MAFTTAPFTDERVGVAPCFSATHTHTIISWECFPYGVKVREVFAKYRGQEGIQIYILK